MTALAGRRTLYRELILSAAEREFAEVGYADTKVATIAKAADLSLATVYKSFGGKSDIWNDLHAERMTALLARVDERSGHLESPLGRLLAGIAAVAEFLTEHDAYLRLSLGASSGWLGVSGGKGVQRTVWDSGLDMISGAVRAARDSGEITDLRPRIAAGMTVSALQVWLADWVESGRDRPADVVVSDLTEHLSALLGGTR